jgi:hypothetical protein
MTAVAREQTLFRLVTALDALAVLVLALFLVERSAWANPVSDYGVPLGMVALFLALPPAAVAWAWLARRAPRPTPGRQLYYAISKLFLTVAWLPGAFLALLLLFVVQPWPISLRQGPDTDYAREGFQRHLRLPPPPEVDDLHYRGEGIGDATYWIAFRCSDPALVERIAQELGLKPVEGEIRELEDPYARRSVWWGRDEGVSPEAAWSLGEVYYLWHARAAGRVFYEARHL